MACLLVAGTPSSGDAATAVTLAGERMYTIAGSGTAWVPATDGVLATEAAMYPQAITAADDGALLFVSHTRQVQRIDHRGALSTVAGSGRHRFDGDGGQATRAGLAATDIEVATNGAILIADAHNHRVRRVAADDTITTVAGSGRDGDSGDGGLAVRARLSAPQAIAATPDGGFFILEEPSRIRKVSPDGIITAVQPRKACCTEVDHGGAVLTDLSYALDIAATADGGFLLAVSQQFEEDASSAGAVWRVAADGSARRVAGADSRGSRRDGAPAAQSQLDVPSKVAVHPDGGFVIGTGQKIYRVTATGEMHRIAGATAGRPLIGVGAGTYDGDGRPARNAAIGFISGLTVSSDGDIAYSDRERIRLVSRGRARLAISLLETRMRTNAVRVRFGTTRSASIRIELLDRGRVAASRFRRTVRARTQDAVVPLPHPRTDYEVRIVARTSDGRRATARTKLNLAALSLDAARNRLTSTTPGEAAAVVCRRFRIDRVDCAWSYSVEDESGSPCKALTRNRINAQFYVGQYECPLRRLPRWTFTQIWLDRQWRAEPLRMPSRRNGDRLAVERVGRPKPAG